MWFRRVDINQVRNLEQVSVELGPGLNYLHGENGAGKTAFLEGLHLLARGRSFRAGQVGDLVRGGAEEMLVHAVIEDELRGRQSLGLGRGRKGRSDLRLNGHAGRKLSEIASLLPLQVMVPSLSDLVFGGPAERRRWLDWGVFHVEHHYLRVLRGYLQAVRQRNAALRAEAAGNLATGGLEPWNEECGRLGEAVDDHRRRYLVNLEPLVQRVLADLAPELHLEMTYRSGWQDGMALRKVMGDSAPTEVKWGATRHGPHRADVELRVSGLAAGASLSRGQGKSLACALMIAQAAWLRDRVNRTPVFLIDDIGAELDLPHSHRFFRQLNALGVQIVATSTAPVDFLGVLPGLDTRVFHVEQGQVRRIDDS